MAKKIGKLVPMFMLLIMCQETNIENYYCSAGLAGILSDGDYF